MTRGRPGMTHSLEQMTYSVERMTRGRPGMTHSLERMTYSVEWMTYGRQRMTRGGQRLTGGGEWMTHGGERMARSRERMTRGSSKTAFLAKKTGFGKKPDNRLLITIIFMKGFDDGRLHSRKR